MNPTLGDVDEAGSLRRIRDDEAVKLFFRINASTRRTELFDIPLPAVNDLSLDSVSDPVALKTRPEAKEHSDEIRCRQQRRAEILHMHLDRDVPIRHQIRREVGEDGVVVSLFRFYSHGESPKVKDSEVPTTSATMLKSHFPTI